jgi:hypothetical protein
MRRLLLLQGLAIALSGWGFTGPAGAYPLERGTPAARFPEVVWRASVAVGSPTDGRLVRGVRLPAEGRDFFTWDPAFDRSPNRAWRRYGTARLVRTVLRVLAAFRAAHPEAPRVGIGDLSLPRGGPFGAGLGGLGHFSHQNGLDVDVYYPRRDRREREPARPSQIDRRLSQDLLDRFLRAGADVVFVGPRTRLRGPPGLVRSAAHHDNHMHVRIFPAAGPTTRTVALGLSALGSPIAALARGSPGSERKFLVVGCIHGNECAGAAVVRRLEAAPVSAHLDLWLVRTVNPDGAAAGTRQNARGVDLNRNFPSAWAAGGRAFAAEYGGTRPLSEPESRIVRSLVRALRPEVTIWFHQPQAIVRAWGRSVGIAARYARLARAPFRAIPWPPGTAPRWQNTRLGQRSFVIELPPGPLAPGADRRYAHAVLRLAAAG